MMSQRKGRLVFALSIAALAVWFSSVSLVHVQPFDSGSNGSDGALNLTQTGAPIEFDPGALGIDADGDNIFHFTTINIATGVTMRLTVRKLHGPLPPTIQGMDFIREQDS